MFQQVGRVGEEVVDRQVTSHLCGARAICVWHDDELRCRDCSTRVFSLMLSIFFFSSRRRHTRSYGDWSSDVCSSDLETMERFVEAFGPCGFRRETFYPCYGLAEASLIVAGGQKAAVPVVRTFQAVPLTRSEEHTSELQSPYDLVCRLLLEKKKKIILMYLLYPLFTVLIILTLPHLLALFTQPPIDSLTICFSVHSISVPLISQLIGCLSEP